MSLLKKILPIFLILSAIPFINFGLAQDDIDMDGVIFRMYNNGLTNYGSEELFKPQKNIRRDEASKFITKFAQSILLQQGQENSKCYMFKDVPKTNKLRDYIIQSCELGYMKGGKNNKFNPAGKLSNAQAVAIIIRMYGGVLDEPQSDRSRNYFSSANELDLLDGLNLGDKKKDISRGNFATLLYRLGELLGEQDAGLDTGYYDDTLYYDDSGNSGTDQANILSYSGMNADFISGAMTCSSGSNISEVTFNILWMDSYIKIYRQIMGLENNKCIVYQRVENFSVTLNYDILGQLMGTGALTSTGLAQFDMGTGAQNIIGKYATCSYSTGELVNLLQAELSGNFMNSTIGTPDYQDKETYACTGTLFDY